MQLELVSSTTGPETTRYGWGNRIRVNGTAITGCSRGWNVAMINGANGQLRAGSYACFDSYAARHEWRGSPVTELEKLVPHINNSLSPDDILVIIIVDAGPYLNESKLAQDKLKTLGVSAATIRILEEKKDNGVAIPGWVPWVFAWQNGQVLLDVTGTYAQTLTRVINIELTPEKTARIAAEQQAAQQAKIQAALVAQQAAEQASRDAEAARIASQTQLAQHQLAAKKQTALRQQALLQAMRLASQEALDLLIEFKGAADTEVQSLTAEVQRLSIAVDAIETELRLLR